MTSDMGELWREWNAFQKVRKAGNLDSFEQAFIETFSKLEGFRKCSLFHYQFLMNGLKVDYWPSSNRWYVKDLPGPNQSFFGTPVDLLNFVQKRTEKPAGPDLRAMTLEEFEEFAIETVKTFRKWWKLSQQASAENGGHSESEFPDVLSVAEWFEQFDMWSDTENEQRIRQTNTEKELDKIADQMQSVGLTMAVDTKVSNDDTPWDD